MVGNLDNGDKKRIAARKGEISKERQQRDVGFNRDCGSKRKMEKDSRREKVGVVKAVNGLV